MSDRYLTVTHVETTHTHMVPGCSHTMHNSSNFGKNSVNCTNEICRYFMSNTLDLNPVSICTFVIKTLLIIVNQNASNDLHYLICLFLGSFASFQSLKTRRNHSGLPSCIDYYSYSR